jgi:hypothetical protein
MKEESNEKNLGLEEEKKESYPRLGLGLTTLEVLQDSLPSELKGTVYNDEGELWEAQQKIGLSDLQIVLTSEGYAVWREMPDTKHNAGVRVILNEFGKWKQEQCAVFFWRKSSGLFCISKLRA